MESDGRLVGSMENIFMASRVLWPSLRVVVVVVSGVVCCLACSLYLVLLSSFVGFSSSLLLVPDFLTRHSNNGFYKLPEN